MFKTVATDNDQDKSKQTSEKVSEGAAYGWSERSMVDRAEETVQVTTNGVCERRSTKPKFLRR
ncbi:unnamed protein product [Enterobius vermicularis]|uniref:Uncharacterized protein n=1 Tax=Enterobius vermicularis TaxID=51028 RepID=A0A0N4UTD4_ENTVE|nr:unnamed protein product [Enterobius vermicularis]